MDCEQSSSTAQKQRKVMWAGKKNSKEATLHYPIAWNRPGDVRSEKPCPDFRTKTSFSLSETRTFHEVLFFSGRAELRERRKSSRRDLASPRHSDSRGQ